MSDILEAYGGIFQDNVWNFGYVPPENRVDDHITSVIPTLDIDNNYRVEPKCVLWQFSLAVNGNRHFKAFSQKTGSCVGNGGGQAIWYMQAMEALRDEEEVILPFYLLPYGRSRLYAGMRGRGEGSYGAAFAKAIAKDGILPFNIPSLDQPLNDPEGITWGRQTELKWSDGQAIKEDWLSQSRLHPVRSVARCNSAQDVAKALQNYYPCTCASDWGGHMVPPIKHGLRLNTRATQWQHQMCVIGWQDNPDLGELFYILNSWGINVHGEPADDAPPGGFWIARSDMDYIAKNGEVFAFSEFDGFPVKHLDWYF